MWFMMIYYLSKDADNDEIWFKWFVLDCNRIQVSDNSKYIFECNNYSYSAQFEISCWNISFWNLNCFMIVSLRNNVYLRIFWTLIIIRLTKRGKSQNLIWHIDVENFFKSIKFGIVYHYSFKLNFIHRSVFFPWFG